MHRTHSVRAVLTVAIMCGLCFHHSTLLCSQHFLHLRKPEDMNSDKCNINGSLNELPKLEFLFP